MFKFNRIALFFEVVCLTEMEYSCAACGKKFSQAEALSQHLQAKHPQAGGAGSPGSVVGSSGIPSALKMPSTNFLVALIVLAAVASGIVWLVAQPPAYRLPGTGEHWHAGFELKICGVRQADFAYSQGDVHTHGDGKIHAHPHSVVTAGENANLAAFFSSVGLGVTNSTLGLPDGRQFKTGDACPGGKAGGVKILVNGRENEDFLKYVPQDGAFVRVEFS